MVDLADYEIPLSPPAAPPKYARNSYPRPAGMAELTTRLEAADAFILVTPKYNHSYPASLKAAIDWQSRRRHRSRRRRRAFPGYRTG